jgi:hypothetical protein
MFRFRRKGCDVRALSASTFALLSALSCSDGADSAAAPAPSSLATGPGVGEMPNMGGANTLPGASADSSTPGPLPSTGSVDPSDPSQVPSSNVDQNGDDTGEVPTVTPAANCSEPGPVPFRVMTRLNRAEYDNTVRDLLGDTTHTALTLLPADAGDGAFDNNAGALNINPALVETYVELAETLATQALAEGSPGRAKVLICDPAASSEDACALEIATDLGTRAFRRALRAGEAEQLLGVYSRVREQGFSFDEGMSALLQAVLLSPHFLFRPEVNESPTAAGQRLATGYELASRLSYFLWSSMPDRALLEAAGSGALDEASAVTEHVSRMLADPKADAFYARFPGLWLRTLDIASERPPAPEIYPAWNQQLADDMEAETAAFLREFMTSEVDFLGILDANFSYLNQRLADFYGIEGEFGSELQRTLLTSEQRGGLLTQGSILRVTSPSERTSPVIRGAWILARILNSASPPPPDNLDIPSLDEDTTAGTPMTTRAKLERHRENTSCAACHNLIDPLGFGLEHFDGIGAWRDQENGVAVDASSMLVTGEPLDGAKELQALLKADPRVSRAISSYLLSYALGRAPSADDRCRLDALDGAFAASDHHMSRLVQEVALNDAFKTRTMAP